MSLRQEVESIIMDKEMSYEAKKEKLSGLMTLQEINALLPKPIEIPKLKEPLSPKHENMRILRLPIAKEFWDSVLQGGFNDQRGNYEYYKKICTYIENGVRYIKPFDAIKFFRGQQWAILELKDIKSDGCSFEFYCGDLIETNVRQ